MYETAMERLERNDRKINMVLHSLQQDQNVTVAGSFNDNFIAVSNNNQ